MYTVEEFGGLLESKGFSTEGLRPRINPNRTVYMLGMEGTNRKFITEFSAIVVIDTTHAPGYSVKCNFYKDEEVNPERGYATLVERVQDLKGNFDEFGEPIPDDQYDDAVTILGVFGN